MTEQHITPLDALRGFGIDAQPDRPFIIVDDAALREVQHAFNEAASQVPAEDWRMFAMQSDHGWRCSVGQARESWPWPSEMRAL